MKVLSTIGQALADPTRLHVLELADGRLAVGEIATALHVTSATASYHVQLLAKAGLVTVEHRGRRHVPLRSVDGRRILARAFG